MTKPTQLQTHPLQETKQVSEKVRLKPRHHQLLLNHLRNLIAANSDDRRKRVQMMASIERDLLGVSSPVGSDCERAQKRAEGRGAATPDRIYPFGYFLLRRYVSDLSAMVMPYEAPYQVAVSINDQEVGNKITRALRHQAAVFDHRNHINACIYDALTFDYFAYEVKKGVVGSYQATTVGSAPANERGFCVEHLDPYNVLCDMSVPPHKLADSGEFVGVVERINLFQAQLRHQQQDLYVEHGPWTKYLESKQTSSVLGNNGGRGTSTYYADIELNRARYEADRDQADDVTTDFTSLFATGLHADKDYSANSLELVRLQVRLDPTKYGLQKGASTGLKLYEILMLEDVIVRAEEITDTNRQFSIRIGTMSYDRQLGRHVAMGDCVGDISSFASNVLNVYKRAKRKGLEGGVTIYNGDVIPLHELDDMSGGRLSTRQMRFDQDIRRHVMQLNDPVDTKNDLRDVEGVLSMLNGVVPTSSQPELAGLDRATEFQAQAVAMTGDRAMLLDGALLDGQLISPIRARLQQLMVENTDEMVFVDETTQQSLGSLTAQDRKRIQFRLVQPSIFIGIDRLRASNVLNQIANISLQVGDQISPLAAMLLKHLMEVSGSPLDMAEYERAIQDTQQQARETAAIENGADTDVQPTAPSEV